MAEKSISTVDHSTRSDQQTSFRFADLPPELRDWILALVLDSDKPLRLVAGLPGAAKALTQVSRAIRADAAKIFYSRNIFHVIIGYPIIGGRPSIKKDAGRMEAWVKTWGILASTNIRSLHLTCGGFRSCAQRICVTPNNRVNPVVYCSRTTCIISHRIRESDIRSIALAVFRRLSEQRSSPEQLSQFIIEVDGIVCECTEQQRSSRVAEALARAGKK